MRARTNISLKNRYTATLSNFKGVDLNTSPLRVAQNRASSMKNFICDNGINHKRPGWEEQFRIVEGGQALAIHGMFPYNEGDKDILLVHAGTGIYKAQKGEQKWTYTRLDDGTLGITENRSQCFYRDGKAFLIGCGNYLVYGEFETGETNEDGSAILAYSLKSVADIAYVPTTSIGCGANSSAEVAASSLEAVNLLTRKRKNTGVTMYSNTSKKGIFLDSESDGDITIEGTVWVGKQPEAGGYDGRIIVEISGTFTPSSNTVTSHNVTCKVTDPLENTTYKKDATFTTTVDWVPASNAIYFPAYWDTPDGKDNITITYTAATDKDYDTKRVQNCRFGVTFGVGGANDRLFLAGNSKYPNMDIWSEYDDFTYFPDGNTMEVGSAHAAITAYARLSDTTLAVTKEEKAGEPTIFYRTSRERTEADGVTLSQWFPVSAGIAGDGTLNPHAVATLSGDVLTLTRGGVHGIVLSSNVASGERYTRERSRPIYRELASADLGTAAAIVYRNRYYLALPGTGKCFVADAHYKATFEGTTDYNYEWWVWENVHAACFAEYEDRLIFGTPKGLVCAFTEGVFSDRTHTELAAGELLDDDTGGVIYGEQVTPKPRDRVVLHGGAYALLGAITAVDENGACTTADIDSYFEGQTVYADTVEGTGLETGVAYTVGERDVNAGTFMLYKKNDNDDDRDDEPVTPKAAGFRLLECMDGVELMVAITDTDDDSVYDKGLNEDHDGYQDFHVARGVSYDEDGKEVWNKLHLSTYNNDDSHWTGRYIHVKPVEAEWVTPIMDLGTNAQSKTLLSLTVATEPGVDGTVTFGYETRRVWRKLEAGRALAVSAEQSDIAVGGGESFSFDDIDFENFTFDTAFACSYTKRMRLRNFNFILFRFGSDKEKDCAVSSVMLQYKINQNNRGVR